MIVDDSKLFVHQLQSDLEKLSELDLQKNAEKRGCIWAKGYLEIEFYNRKIEVRPPEFIDRGGHPVSDAVKSVLTQYLLSSPDQDLENEERLISFREFPGAGPLVYRFTANTSKIVETQFGKDIETLEKKCVLINGSVIAKAGFDLAVRFWALPRIPILFLYNGPEDGLPPSASFLYAENAAQWLDIQGLMVLTTYLTGCLITDGLNEAH